MKRDYRKAPASATFGGVVLIDNREQLPYTFDSIAADVGQGGGPLTVRTLTVKLESGDYSLEGHTTEVAVERKSAADLYRTLGKDRPRFVRELERLDAMKFAAVVVEAELSELMNDPPKYSKLPFKSLWRSVLAFQQRYPRVHWLFVGGREWGEVATFRILERFTKERDAERKADSKAERRAPSRAVGGPGGRVRP